MKECGSNKGVLGIAVGIPQTFTTVDFVRQLKFPPLPKAVDRIETGEGGTNGGARQVHAGSVTGPTRFRLQHRDGGSLSHSSGN